MGSFNAGYLLFTIAALSLVLLLITLLEAIVLQLIRWDVFKAAFLTSSLMNLLSSLFVFPILGLVSRLGLYGLALAWVCAFVIDSLVLAWRERRRAGSSLPARSVLSASLLVNLVSFLLILLPAFLLAD